MKNDKKIISTRRLVASALTTLRATARPTVLIVLLGMVLPQALLGVAFDAASAGVVAALRARFAARAAEPGNFLDLLAPAVEFTTPMTAYLAGLMVGIVACYFALVHVAVHFQRSQASLSTGRALWLGLRSTIPSGLVVLICLFLLTLVGQVLIAPAILIAAMSLAVPVVLVAEGKGALRSVWEALTLRYARRSDVSGWGVLFALLTLGALFYALVALIGLASQGVMRLDQPLGLKRDVWSATIGDWPFGPVYLAATMFEAAASSALVAALPALTTTLYFSVVGRREIGRA